jgi:hypothetical protein
MENSEGKRRETIDKLAKVAAKAYDEAVQGLLDFGRKDAVKSIWQAIAEAVLNEVNAEGGCNGTRAQG